jgi:hypothetical protein
MTPERSAAVAALGEVGHLYAPNTFHHAWIGQWAGAHPRAVVHGPAALRRKRSDLTIGRAHDAPDAGVIDDAVLEVHVDGFRMEETLLLHRRSDSLIVTDLFHNIGTPPERWTKVYATAMGFYGRVALSRAIRWTAFRDARAARRSVDEVLAQPFSRIVVGHGAPIVDDAKVSMAEALAFLPKARDAALRLPKGGRSIVARKPCG